MRVTFFCFAKRKSPKKRRPPVCDPCAALRGKPAAVRLRGAPWNSLCCCAAPLGQPRRVRSRSTRAPTRVPPHNRPAAGAASRGWTAEHPNIRSGRRCARPGNNCAQREALAPAKWGRAQRRPEWMFAPHPLCMRRGAQRPADQGSRLSERSEFERDPAGREHRRLPEAKRRDADSGVAFFCLLFLATQEKKVPRRGHIPADGLSQGMTPKRPPALTNKAQPATKTGAPFTQPPCALATARPTPQTSNKSPA